MSRAQSCETALGNMSCIVARCCCHPESQAHVRNAKLRRPLALITRGAHIGSAARDGGPAALPGFKGNVTAVSMSPFWDEPLAAIQAKYEKVRQMAFLLRTENKDAANADGSMSKEQQRDYGLARHLGSVPYGSYRLQPSLPYAAYGARHGPRRWRPRPHDCLLAGCDQSRFGLSAVRDH